MSAEEVWATPIGEMDDLIACYGVEKGVYRQTRKPIKMVNDVPDID